jgi:hypothetical protein
MFGAALATIGTAVYVLAASTRATHRHLDVALDPGRLARIGLAGAGTVGGLAVATVLGLPWLLVALLGGVLYLAALWAVGLIRPDQLTALRRPNDMEVAA